MNIGYCFLLLLVCLSSFMVSGSIAYVHGPESWFDTIAMLSALGTIVSFGLTAYAILKNKG